MTERTMAMVTLFQRADSAIGVRVVNRKTADGLRVVCLTLEVGGHQIDLHVEDIKQLIDLDSALSKALDDDACAKQEERLRMADDAKVAAGSL